MTKMKGPPVAVTITVEHVTEKAVLVKPGFDDQWIPKSQIHREPNAPPFEKGETYDVEIPEWLGKKVGLL